MRSIGEIFQEERRRKNLSINEIVEKTRIPKEFLIAIEADHYTDLPKGLYPRLYIKTYAEFLGLPEQKMVAIFRRDYREAKKERSQSALTKVKSLSNWQRAVIAGVIFFLFTGYLFYQYLSFVRPPLVRIQVIDSPSEGRMIKGKTDPQVSLKIEGEMIPLDKEGNFSYQIKDREKEEIVIIVESLAGKSRKIIKKL